MIFENREEAGKLIAKKLAELKGRKNVIVIGLARGGVVVAYEVAKILALPLNVIVPRKIGAPGNSELAIGSIAEGGIISFNRDIISLLNVSKEYIEAEVKKEQTVANQRLKLYRHYAPLPPLEGKEVILVDDGIATGSTMRACIEGMKKLKVQRIIVAVPVAATDSLSSIRKAADDVICLFDKYDFVGVGMYYRHFNQTSDDEVVELLKDCNLDK